MAVVQTPSGLVSSSSPFPRPAPRLGLELYHGLVEDYASIYRTQPNVRTVVRFLSRGIASTPLKGYRKVDAANREELPPDHELSELLRSPAPGTPSPPSRHRFVRTLVEDLAIFDRYYALKMRNPQTGRLNIVRVPPQMMTPRGGSFLGPDYFELRSGSTRLEYGPADVIHLFGHDPSNPVDGVSPLEALRRVIAEDTAAGEYREQFWRNAARVPGVITRPAEAPRWSDPARNRFAQDWRATWAGSGSEQGGTPILEDGMLFESTGFSAKDSEYLGARRLSREEAAALYHVPPAFVGILDNANFANMREQHVGLYVDTYGPWFDSVTTELELQLLPELEDSSGIYLEFSIEAKLAGNFEEQATAIQSSTGAPWMTRNEARALRNLPPVEGGDELVVPLNVLTGGMASPTDTAPPPPGALSRSGPAGSKTRGEKASVPRYAQGWERKSKEILSKFLKRQREAVLSRIGAGHSIEDSFDRNRWNAELSKDLLALSVALAEDLGGAVAKDLGAEWSPDRAIGWLKRHAEITADRVNDATLGALRVALAGVPRKSLGMKEIRRTLEELDGLDLLDDDLEDPTDPLPPAREVFDGIEVSRLDVIAVSLVTGIGQWSRLEGARQGGGKSKTWIGSGAPDSRHAALNGETVPISETFSNGGLWPGDPSLGVDETAGCLCSLEFEV